MELKETKEKLKKEKIRQGQEEIKRRRQERINLGLPAQEIEDIEKNLHLHKILYILIKLMRIINLCRKDFPDKKKFLKAFYEEHPEYKGRPIIFAPNHVRKQDIEILMEAIPFHMVLLSGDYENVHDDFGGPLLEKNGIVYFDMKNPYDTEELRWLKNYLDELEELIDITKDEILIKEYEEELKHYNELKKSIINDRKNVVKTIHDILVYFNKIWFYEGSWNLSKNKPYYMGSYQMVQTAVDTNAIVLPISFDLVKKFGKVAAVRFGTPIDYRKIYENKKLSKEEKIEGLDLLQGEIGKGIFDIWDKYSHVKRDKLVKKYGKKLKAKDYFTPDYNAGSLIDPYWDAYKKKVLGEWKFTEEDIEKKHFVDKNTTVNLDGGFKHSEWIEPRRLFNHLNDIVPNKDNAFLLSKKNHH